MAGRDPPPPGGTSLPPKTLHERLSTGPPATPTAGYHLEGPRSRMGIQPLRSSAARIWLSHSVPSWRPCGSWSRPSQRHVVIMSSTRIRHLRSKTWLTPGYCSPTLFERVGEVEFERPTTTRLKAMNNSRFFVVSTLPGCGSPCSNCSPRCSPITRLRLRNVWRPPRSDDRCRGDRDLRRDADRVQRCPAALTCAWITQEPPPCVPVPPPCSR